MKWHFAVPTLAAALLAAACTSDKSNRSISAPTRPRSTLNNNANVDLDQWANGTATKAASWQNGDINGNNSTYAEGKVVPFRLALENLATSPPAHFITIQYDFTSSGHKAYDFLTNADATEGTIYNSICTDGGGGVSSLCGSSTDLMPNTVPFVDVPYLTDTFEGPSGKTVAGAISGSSTAGTRTLRIYGISNASQVSLSQMIHTGSFTGNSEAQFLVTFSPDVAGPVLFVWGGHLAESGYWDATPNGSSTIQGAPWHMRTQNLDGGGSSNQDRSIQPSAIVPPALSVVKVADPVGPVSAGNDIGFDITVTNGGPGSAFNVTINDPLPSHAGISWSTTTPGCTVTGTPQVLSCTIMTLLATSGSNTFVASVTSHTTSAACALITNNGATVNAANIPNPVVSGPASVTVLCPDLHISKTAKPVGPVSAGDNIGFEIVFSNGQSAGSATNVGFSDPLPSVGGTWQISSQTASACSINSQTSVLTCSGINLAAGGNYTVDVTSGTTSAACGLVNNTATVTGTNISSSASVTVNCPTVSITKTADGSLVDAGSQIGFTVTVTNSGPGTAKGVTVSDVLPTGTGISWSIAATPAASPANVWSIGGSPATLSLASTDLASGQSASVHIVSNTTAGSCALYSNTATASLTNGASPKPVTATTTVQCPTISITKTPDNATVSAGSTIGFTITVTNTGAAGAATAKGVTVSDPLPTGTDVLWSVAASPAATPSNAWSISSGATQTLALASTDLAPGQSASVHITSPTTGSSCKAYPNTATASATNLTTHPYASATTTVQCPHVTLTKTADAAAVYVGSQIGFVVTVANSGAAGTGTAKGVTVNDPLPSGTGISWSIAGTPTPATGWSITGGVLTLAATDLAPGASASVHVVSGTTGAACQQYDNTASATVANGTSPSDAKASEIVHCYAKITVTKTVVGGGTTQFDFSQNTPTNTSYSMGNGGSTLTDHLTPGTYRLCEVLIPVGFSTTAGWSTTAQLDGVAVTLINPDAPTQDLGNRCADVTVTYGDSKTLAWTNSPPPGGDSRTIGYWKNWSSCTGGGQYTKAQSRNELYATLDGNLPQTLDTYLTISSCADAVNILNKNDLKGTKYASDPAYNLAAQLLAAQLNFQAAKKVCPTAGTAVLNAQALLTAIKFNGIGAFAKSMTATQVQNANTYATQLDNFNNNRPGSC